MHRRDPIRVNVSVIKARPPVNKRLIIATVGDESVHRTWLTGHIPRSFDLALVYFGDTAGRHARDADYYIARKGIKFALLHDVFKNELRSIIQRYDHVWVP